MHHDMNMSDVMSMNSMSSMDSMGSMRDDEGPLVVMGSWMPTMKTMIMSYGGYFKEKKKSPTWGNNCKS